MVPWLVVGWIGASLLAAVVFHLVRDRLRPVPVAPEVRAFVRQLEEVLRRDHPDVGIVGMVPGRFAIVLEVVGQETAVPLHHLFRHAVAFPEALPEMVARLLQEIGDGGLDRIDGHDFAAAAAHVLPQVRSADWVARSAPSFGDAALITRPLGEDLRVCYVVDEPWSMVFVCQGHLRRWERDVDEVHRLAVQNLRRLMGDRVPLPGPGEAPLVVRTGDGYAAARVLLLDPEQAEGLLVAMPERDTLWIGSDPAAPGGLADLMALNREQSESSPHPVSPSLYRVRGGELRPLADDEAG